MCHSRFRPALRATRVPVPRARASNVAGGGPLTRSGALRALAVPGRIEPRVATLRAASKRKSSSAPYAEIASRFGEGLKLSSAEGSQTEPRTPSTARGPGSLLHDARGGP
jgi:hypothetical protein